MKKKLLLGLLLCFLLVGCGKETKKENNEIEPAKYNKNESIIKATTVDDITFNVKSFYYYDEHTTLSLEITNNKDKEVDLSLYKINVKRRNDLVGSFDASLSSILEPGNKVSVEYSIDKQILDGDTLEYDLSNMKIVK